VVVSRVKAREFFRQGRVISAARSRRTPTLPGPHQPPSNSRHPEPQAKDLCISPGSPPQHAHNIVKGTASAAPPQQEKGALAPEGMLAHPSVPAQLKVITATTRT
jgi:hypothetical protein